MTSTLNPTIWTALHANRKSMTDDQQRRFIEEIGKVDAQTKALGLLLYYTGCRVSEALAVQRDHICNINHFVVINTLKKRMAPASKPAMRCVPIPIELTAILLDLPVGQDLRLWPYSRWTALRRLKPILLAAGVTGAAATTRGFRHSYQDRIVKVDMPTPARSALLGHTALINEGHYGDPIGYELRDMVEASWEENR